MAAGFPRASGAGFEERRTSDIVAEKLAEWGIEVHRGLAKTGVVGMLRGGTTAARIGLRADMDCLPMHRGRPASHKPRRCRARCMPAAMTATPRCCSAPRKYLAETRNFDGTVYFIFQPAEEGGGGGKVMVEEGLFERFPCDERLRHPQRPDVPLGERRGSSPARSSRPPTASPSPSAASAATARMPHSRLDPVLVGAQLVTALQASWRATDPMDTAVVSITRSMPAAP